MSRLEKLAKLGIEPDALAVLEKYGKTLPRDIKTLDEKALAEMKLESEQLGKLHARRVAWQTAIAKPEPEPIKPDKPKAAPKPRKAKVDK